jgi:hypothetical protein
VRNWTSLEYGQDGEGWIEEKLIEAGYQILSSSWRLGQQKESPRFNWNGVEYDLPEPDMVVERDGIVAFVECKRKKKWVTSKKREGEIGFDARTLPKYSSIRDIANIPFLVAFVIDSDESLSFVDLDTFEEKARYWDGMNEWTGERIKSPDYLIERKYLIQWQ